MVHFGNKYSYVLNVCSLFWIFSQIRNEGVNVLVSIFGGTLNHPLEKEKIPWLVLLECWCFRLKY